MANGWGGARPGAGRKPLSVAEHKRRGTFQPSRHNPWLRAPTLFWRKEWSFRSTRPPSLAMRLKVPGWYPEGLTVEERRVLRLIAAGQRVEGVKLSAAEAREAAEFPWLKRPRRK